MASLNKILKDLESLSPSERLSVMEKMLMRSEPESPQTGKGSFLERAKGIIGAVDDAPEDLSVNPDYFKGYGT